MYQQNISPFDNKTKGKQEKKIKTPSDKKLFLKLKQLKLNQLKLISGNWNSTLPETQLRQLKLNSPWNLTQETKTTLKQTPPTTDTNT